MATLFLSFLSVVLAENPFGVIGLDSDETENSNIADAPDPFEGVFLGIGSADRSLIPILIVVLCVLVVLAVIIGLTVFWWYNKNNANF